MTDKPLSDSPWFWLMLFSLFGAMALMAVSGKYGKRQATIERRFQIRQSLADAVPTDSLDPVSLKPVDQMPLSNAQDTLIPLWPLAVVLCAVAVGAGATLAKTRLARTRISLPPPGKSPVP